MRGVSCAEPSSKDPEDTSGTDEGGYDGGSVHRTRGLGKSISIVFFGGCEFFEGSVRGSLLDEDASFCVCTGKIHC